MDRGAVMIDRAGAVWLASAVAVLPLAALAGGATEAGATTLSSFRPSTKPMMLKRIMRRPLPGGAQVLTARTYRIRFVPEDKGYRIEGELVAVEVDVPKPFEPLAALERDRPDTGMFPMRVDHAGRFLPAQARGTGSFAKNATAVAGTLLPSGLSQGDARDATAFIGQLGANPVHTAWPEDLFNPAPGRKIDAHVVPLPDGKTGQVSIEIEAAVDPSTGLVQSLRRHVTTSLSGSARVTEETWTLAAAK